MKNETLSWDETVTVHAESILTSSGYKTLVHADDACAARLDGNIKMIRKNIFEVSTDVLCTSCTAGIVATSISSSVISLRDAQRRLEKIESNAGVRSDAVAVRAAIESIESVHPEFSSVYAEVSAAADSLAQTLPVYH